MFAGEGPTHESRLPPPFAGHACPPIHTTNWLSLLPLPHMGCTCLPATPLMGCTCSCYPHGSHLPLPPHLWVTPAPPPCGKHLLPLSLSSHACLPSPPPTHTGCTYPSIFWQTPDLLQPAGSPNLPYPTAPILTCLILGAILN